MFATIIKGGRVIDPALGFGKDAHVFIKDKKIAAVETDSPAVQKTLKSFDEDQIIDASGKLVVPGLIDINIQCQRLPSVGIYN